MDYIHNQDRSEEDTGGFKRCKIPFGRIRLLVTRKASIAFGIFRDSILKLKKTHERSWSLRGQNTGPVPVVASFVSTPMKE